MMTLVTGGTGFVGSNIVRALVTEGHEVISLDIAAPNDLVFDYLRNWLDKITWIQADVRDVNVLNGVLLGSDIQNIVHAAAFTNSRSEQGSTYDKYLVDNNLTGALNILDLGIRLAVKRFLFVSSGAVYGGLNLGTDELIQEDIVLSPNSLYGITKYAIEMLCKRYGTLYGIQTVSVRLGTVYGPMERETGHRTKMSLMHQWIGKAIRQESINFKDYRVEQDLIYAVDIGQAIRFLLDEPYLNYDVYNIGSGKIISKLELYLAMCNAFPRNSIDFVGVSRESFARMESESEKPTHMDISRLISQGYTPKYDIGAGLKDYMFRGTEPGFVD